MRFSKNKIVINIHCSEGQQLCNFTAIWSLLIAFNVHKKLATEIISFVNFLSYVNSYNCKIKNSYMNFKTYQLTLGACVTKYCSNRFQLFNLTSICALQILLIYIVTQT